MATRSVDLSGTYAGTVNYPDGGLIGNALLTITGNEFTLKLGSFTQAGRITALTGCGETSVQFTPDDLPAAAAKPIFRLPTTSLIVRTDRDGLVLRTYPGAVRSFSFDGMLTDPLNEGLTELASTRVPDIPQFKWPPPEASASVAIPFEFLKGRTAPITFGDVSEHLRNALDQTGYDELSWYGVPGGFALVSRFEQCDADGRPLPGAARYLPKIFKPEIRGILDFAGSLLFPRKGRFRVIVFVVTSYPFSQQNVTVTPEEARAWLNRGLNGLPEQIAKLQFNSGFLVTALIYEFEQESDDSPARFKRPSTLTGKMHLQSCRLWEVLGGQ